jgi:hypothetical protein
LVGWVDEATCGWEFLVVLWMLTGTGNFDLEDDLFRETLKSFWCIVEKLPFEISVQSAEKATDISKQLAP